MFSALKHTLEYLGFDVTCPEDCIKESKAMRENLTELQIDKTLEDTFPASDPPAWY